MAWQLVLGILFAILAFVELGRTVLAFYHGLQEKSVYRLDHCKALLINTIVLGVCALIILWITNI